MEVNERGQLVMRALIEASLQRIDRDPKGLAERLFPWTREPQEPVDFFIGAKR